MFSQHSDSCVVKTMRVGQQQRREEGVCTALYCSPASFVFAVHRLSDAAMRQGLKRNENDTIRDTLQAKNSKLEF